MVLVTAVAVGLEVPLELVLSPGAQPLGIGAELWVTAVFAADLFAHRWSMGPAAPRGVAARRAWHLIDGVAALPLALLTGIPALALVRLLKLTRLASVGRALRASVAVHPTIPRFGLFLVVLVVSAHGLACGWMALGGPSRGGGATTYLDALYWTVTTLATVGYGDVTPATTAQTVYAMAVMLLGVGVYGFVIGNLATLLTRVDMARAEHMATLDRLSAFMRYRRVPAELQRQVHDYHRYLWDHRLGYDEAALIQGLPSALRRKLTVVLKADLVEKLSFLEGASRELIHDLCAHLQPVVFMPGEVIVRQGEYGRHVYFVSSGSVRVEDGTGAVIRTLGEGDFFGELSLLTRQPRTATVRAAEYCDLYTLDRETFRRTLDHYPDFAARVAAVTEERGGLPEADPS